MDHYHPIVLQNSIINHYLFFFVLLVKCLMFWVVIAIITSWFLFWETVKTQLLNVLGFLSLIRNEYQDNKTNMHPSQMLLIIRYQQCSNTMWQLLKNKYLYVFGEVRICCYGQMVLRWQQHQSHQINLEHERILKTACC